MKCFHHIFLGSLLSALLSVLVTTCVLAQQKGDVDSLAWDIDLEDIVLTAQYKPTDIKKVMHEVDVIPQEVISKIGAARLDDILALSPQIRLENDPILGSRISLRGIDASNVAILVDGVPVIGRQDGAIDINQIPVQNIERVEIVQGPLSQVYGTNAAGGVINLITRTNKRSGWQVTSSHQLETIDRRQHDLSVGYRQDKWSIRAHGGYFEYDEFPIDSLRTRNRDTLPDGEAMMVERYPWNPKAQYMAGGSIRYFIDHENSLQLKVDHNQEEVRDYGRLRRPQWKPYADDRFYETTRNDFSLSYDGKLSDRLFVDAVVAYNDFERKTKERRFMMEEMKNDTAASSDELNQLSSWFSRLNVGLPLNKKWEFVGGLNLMHAMGQGDRIVDTTRADSTDVRATEVSAYAQVKYTFNDMLELQASGRYIWHSLFEGAFTPAVQMRYAPSKEWNIKASYGLGYRSPDLRELYLEFVDINHFILGNQELNPEFTKDAQLHIDYTPSKLDDLILGLGAYCTEISDRITLTQIDPEDATKLQYENIDEFRVKGIQGDIGFKQKNFDFSFGFNLGFTEVELEAEEAPAENRVWDMTARLGYEIPKTGVGLMANYRYVGADNNYMIDDAGELQISEVAGYDMLDMSASRSFWKDRISMTVGVRNAFDTQYIEVRNPQNGGANPHGFSGRRLIDRGRSYFARLQLSF